MLEVLDTIRRVPEVEEGLRDECWKSCEVSADDGGGGVGVLRAGGDGKRATRVLEVLEGMRCVLEMLEVVLYVLEVKGVRCELL